MPFRCQGGTQVWWCLGTQIKHRQNLGLRKGGSVTRGQCGAQGMLCEWVTFSGLLACEAMGVEPL